MVTKLLLCCLRDSRKNEDMAAAKLNATERLFV